MSFYPQPDEWSCGPFALKHSLIAIGKFVSEDELASVARTHWWSGTDELRLARAARSVDTDLDIVRRFDAESARRSLIEHLDRRLPVLLCVDDWAHWIAVLRHQQGRFVVVDSNLDPVLNVLSWRALEARWRFLDTDYSEDAPPELYDLILVKPRTRPPMRADFSIARVKYLRRPAHRKLAVHWDEFVDDLSSICRPRSGRMESPLSMNEFLRRNRAVISKRIRYWHGDVDLRPIDRLFEYYEFVAATYGLVIPKSAVRRAVVDVTALVTLWVAARFGIDPFYDES